MQVAVPDPEPALGVHAASDGLSPDDHPAADLDHPDTAKPRVMDGGVALRAAIKAGVLGVFVGIIPILGIVLTGALAVYLYRREKRSILPAGPASRLGGAAGVIAFAINGLFIAIRIFVFHAQQASLDDFMKIAQAIGLNTADPDVQASIHNLFTPAGMAATLFFGMMIAIVLAAVGGALASVFLQPSRKTGSR